MTCRFALGTANFHDYHGKILDTQFCDKILDKAIASNIKTFDTSHSYGMAEKILADKLRNISDRDIEIICKTGIPDWRDNMALSVSRFHNKHITLMWHNWADGQSDLNLLWEMSQVAEKNKCNFGVSTYGPYDPLKYLDLQIGNTVQVEFNILNWRHMVDVLPKARSMGCKVYLRSVFQRGYLTNRRAPFVDNNENKLAPILKELYLLADSNGMTLEELALKFVIELAPEQRIIIGCDTPQEIEKNLKYQGSLSEPIMEKIKDLTWSIDFKLTDLRTWK